MNEKTWLDEAAEVASAAFGTDGSWRDVVSAVDALASERDMRTEIPGPAKTIVVTEASGRRVHYALPAFGELRNGGLVIGRHLDDSASGEKQIEVGVMYPPGEWKRVAKDGAEVPDELGDAVRYFAKTWAELLASLPDDYTCHMTCAEANAAADLYRALGDDVTALAILGAHMEHDDEIEAENHGSDQ